jgi:hypothetical protein
MPSPALNRPIGVQVKVYVAAAGLVACGLLAATPARAWSPETAVEIARQAATIAPPDLKRQIEKYKAVFKEGILEPVSNPSQTGLPLDEVIENEITRAVVAIRSHQPMSEIVRQIGVATYYIAHANNPLVIGRSDPDERTYFADYLRYVESARKRFVPVFYGLVPEFEHSGQIPDLLKRTFRRGQLLYPLVGREYDRIGGPHGRQKFDDRSTAFGLSAVAYSQAVTDASIVLRHIWLEAGGADPRGPLLVRKGEFQVPRTSAIPLRTVQEATSGY